MESLGPQLYQTQLTESDLSQRVRVVLHDVLTRDQTPLPAAERAALAQQIADEILGYGPLEPFLRDSEVTEVMVNGYDTIYIERFGKIELVDAAFSDDAHLRRTIDKIVGRVGRRVDESSPMVDARLPDGSRVNAIVPPLAVDGAALTIRKFAADPFTVEDLISFDTISREVADFLDACVRGKANILVVGWYGRGQDDDAQRALQLHPRGRAHRHHRGRSRAAAPSGARDPAGVPPVQHRGPRRGDDPRPGQELAAHAP